MQTTAYRFRTSLVVLLGFLALAVLGCANSAPEAEENQAEQRADRTAEVHSPGGESTPAEDMAVVEPSARETASELGIPDTRLPHADVPVKTQPKSNKLELQGPELGSPMEAMSLDKKKLPNKAPISRSIVRTPERQPEFRGVKPSVVTENRSNLSQRMEQPLVVRELSREPTRGSGPSAARATPPKTTAMPFELVKVYYATDRKAIALADKPILSRLDVVPPLAGIGTTLLFLVIGMAHRVRRLFWGMAIFTSTVTVAWAGVWLYAQWPARVRPLQKGICYGNERGPVQMGTCEVSIPETHAVGQLESPSILRLEVREDVRKHIVLQHTESKPKSAFFAELRQQVKQADQAEVFVFVHGYNVTFADAARRTAQIAYDVKFSGVPIFFSWPSQGGLLEYTVDETNVAWAVPHLKQFLLDVVKQSGAESVNLIAHSMGSRALTQALHELELELKDRADLFNQIILAAPDIDAEVFRRDLAPALVRTSKHVTLYASSNDEALAASKHVHGYPRAGESGNGIVVLPGVDTIDVSHVDHSILGHSYYGSSNPILRDIYFLIHDALPAAQRRWLRPASYGGLTYWVFDRVQRTAARNMR